MFSGVMTKKAVSEMGGNGYKFLFLWENQDLARSTRST